jgi:chromosome segregation ATPase
VIKNRLCREYLTEIDRLERSIVELEEQITELKMQLRLKVDEANGLSIENASLRHKLELMNRRERALLRLLKSINAPFVFVDEERFEDVDVDLGPDSKE